LDLLEIKNKKSRRKKEKNKENRIRRGRRKQVLLKKQFCNNKK